MACLIDRIFPLLTRFIRDRNDVDGCSDHLAKLIQVFKGDLPIDAVPGPVEFHINGFRHGNGRVLLHLDIGMIPNDREILGRGWGGQQDEGDDKVEAKDKVKKKIDLNLNLNLHEVRKPQPQPLF